MIAAFGSGVVAGYAIALPIGPVGVYLVSLGARTSRRVAAAAALGVATVDGAYALAAGAGGGAVAGLLGPARAELRWVSVGVVAVVAAVTLARAWPTRPEPMAPAGSSTAGRAYLLLVGLTAVNPTTALYFVALAVGTHGAAASSSIGGGLLFALGALASSASWQLTLAASGAVLGRLLRGARGQRIVAATSGVVMAVLAAHLAAG